MDEHSVSIQPICLYISKTSNSAQIFSRSFSLSNVAAETMCSSLTGEEAALILLGLQHPLLYHILRGHCPHCLQTPTLTPGHHHAGLSHIVCGRPPCPALDPSPHAASLPPCIYSLYLLRFPHPCWAFLSSGNTLHPAHPVTSCVGPHHP